MNWKIGERNLWGFEEGIKMIKVIKTNLSIVNDKIMDHQSYIEEEESWESFIEKVKSGFLFSKTYSVPVDNIKYDDFHLSCDVDKSSGLHTKHFAIIEGYVITE
jgi:hypothetical protein